MKRYFTINRDKAVELAVNHNCVSREIAERYTDSELKEVVRAINQGSRCVKIKCDF